MALVPIISQSWDTNSVFTPTRMNNIEQNLAIVSNATGVKYSNGVSVKDAIDTKVRMESGIATIQCTQANYNFNEDVAFTNAFTNMPQVMVCIDGDGTVGGTTVSCRNITKNGFRVSAQTTLTSSPTVKVKWLAVGN